MNPYPPTPGPHHPLDPHQPYPPTPGSHQPYPPPGPPPALTTPGPYHPLEIRQVIFLVDTAGSALYQKSPHLTAKENTSCHVAANVEAHPSTHIMFESLAFTFRFFLK